MAQTVEKVYSIQVEGIDSFNDLRQAIEQLNDKLKTLNETSQEYRDTLAELTQYQKQLSDAMQGISTSAEKTDASLTNIKDTVDSVTESITTLGEDVIDSFVDGFAQGMAEVAINAEEMGDNMEKGVNSVKDLKQEISDLRDKLVTLEKGSEEYNATVKELIDDQVKLKEVMNAGKNEIQAAEGSYNALSQRMSALKQVWKETTDEATRNEIGKQIAEINTQLKSMDSSIGNFQRNVGNYQSALDGLDGSFVKWKQELRECKEALEQLDPSTQEYADTMARASELTHLMADQQEMIKYSSADLGDQLNNIRGIASNLAAGYSAVNAAMGLFGGENEEVAQALLKVQQAMALVQGLQGIDGFIKRTKGLSQSMGLVTKATQANTVATKANAAASKADAVAKGAETVATKAAVPAQLSLNAAMKANPIGFIVGLIATLVTAMMLLKDKIMEMIGANAEMSAAFNKVKAVLAGVGNIIKKSVINPIKMAIIPIKTLAKVMIDMFKGDWSKIGDDIKAGFDEMKDTAIDSINVVKQFKEGYDKETAKQNDAARKKEAEARSKELDDVIKDNEAKYGSDWKYTKEAKKLYDEMFKARMAQYKEDSEEYKEAAREKTRYEKEFRDNQAELAKNAAKAELEYKKALYGDEYEWSDEWHQKVLDGLEDAQEAYDKAKQTYDNTKRDFEKAQQEGIDLHIIRYDKATQKTTQIAKENVDEFLKQQKIAVEEQEKILNEEEANVKKYERRLGDYNKAQAQKRLSEYKSTLNDIRSNFEKFVPDLFREQWNFDDILDKWEKSVKIYKGYLKNVRKLTDEEIEEIVSEIRSKLVKEADDAIVNASLSNLEKDFSNIDRVVKQTMANISAEFNLKEVVSGITIPDEAIENIENLFKLSSQSTIDELIKVENEIDRLYEKFTGDETKPYFGMAVEELGKTLPSFQKLLDKKNELEARYNKLELERFQNVSEIQADAYERSEKKESTYYSNLLKSAELWYNQEEALFEKRQQWYMGENEIEALKRQEEYENKYFNTTMEMYQKLRDRYYEMSTDMTLTAEERENAEREAAKVTGQIIEEEMNHQTQMLKIQRDNIKAWQNAVKDAAKGIGDILGTIGDAWSSLIELEKTEIAQQLENGEITQEEAKKREQANKESFENLKKIQIAEAIINALASAVGAYQSMASIPYVGPVLGAVAAAAALASGYAQVRQIQATNYESSSTGGGSSSSSTNFQLPNVMELEPELRQNLTGMDDIDSLNNDGSGRGRGGDTVVKAYVVESDINAAQKVSSKRNQEVTF